MEEGSTIGLDIAKRVFQVHAARSDGSVVLRREPPHARRRIIADEAAGIQRRDFQRRRPCKRRTDCVMVWVKYSTRTSRLLSLVADCASG